MNNQKKPEMAGFAKRAKELRKERGKTQVDMARLISCTASHYQKMEYGEINVPSMTLMALADYFGVTTDYLLGRSDEGGPEPK